MTIILLTGKSFTGKDTIAKRIPELKRISIADTMKRKYMKVYPDRNLFDRDTKDKYRTSLMKFTHVYPFSYWLEKTKYQDNCIVTDIRTLEEINYIKSRFKDVKVISLTVSEQERTRRGWVKNPVFDDSYLEQPIEYEYDEVLINGTEEDLELNVKTIKQKYLTSYFENTKYQGLRMATNPHNGVKFLVPTELYSNPEIRNKVISDIISKLHQQHDVSSLTHVLAMESGGYILGSILADRLGLGFVQARKSGKLPPLTISQNYSMEYREENCIEVQSDAFDIGYMKGTNKNAKVLIIDDIMVTGGTLHAGVDILKRMGVTPTGVVLFAEITCKERVPFDIPVTTHVTL